MRVPDAVGSLARELAAHFGDRLHSLVVYGLRAHAGDHAHDHGAHGGSHAHDRETHTVVVVDRVGPHDLRALAARIDRWHEEGLATPLLLGSQEVARSLDAFPFELGAIMADCQVVAGANPFAGLTVDHSDLRRACEVQVRGHLLHLRGACLEARGRADALSDVLVRSAPALATLVTTVARLDSEASDTPVTSARALERRLGLPPESLAAIVALVGAGEIPSASAERLFAPYLSAVERLVEYVDGWKHRAERT